MCDMYVYLYIYLYIYIYNIYIIYYIYIIYGRERLQCCYDNVLTLNTKMVTF